MLSYVFDITTEELRPLHFECDGASPPFLLVVYVAFIVSPIVPTLLSLHFKLFLISSKLFSPSYYMTSDLLFQPTERSLQTQAPSRTCLGSIKLRFKNGVQSAELKCLSINELFPVALREERSVFCISTFQPNYIFHKLI